MYRMFRMEKATSVIPEYSTLVLLLIIIIKQIKKSAIE